MLLYTWNTISVIQIVRKIILRQYLNVASLLLSLTLIVSVVRRHCVPTFTLQWINVSGMYIL